ncbi:histidine kinase-like protein [Trichoderma citrinoviride]|uniref:Histidine kinase-like protein n=1 Tax=Trichoderma citrinoviride TaxID=58853 RepID=A0A2T4BIK2_9HYPO|nr:histidine kinase-like protein [Trichoderma citrinoviride]PTB69130.1 histidine kinase-like protein [Trichoderma citrinoviride]
MSPTSPSASGDRAAQIRQKRAMSGPYSSVHADAARHSSIPIALNLSISDRDDEDGSEAPADENAGDDEALEPTDASVTSEDRSLEEDTHVATRFTHVITDEGHAVITGRDGALQRCEDEPIHIPGAIQSFGVLLAMREEGEGQFVVRYVSENSKRLLGYTPQQLFRLESFLNILTEEQQDNLLDHIDFIRDEDADPAANGPEVFGLSIKGRKDKKSVKLWCAMHINSVHPDMIICEFEKDDDQEFPLRPPEEMTEPTTADTLNGNPTLEQIEESTEILSKPLRILRSARKRRGDQGAMQVFDIMSQVQEQLSSAPDLDIFLKVLIGIVKELTGFHRIMIYQFDSAWNGKVVAELLDASKSTDLYKGLHFPASDIPAQARSLYKVNKVRLLYDRDLETARIVCRTKEDLDIPLDMTHAYLRAMSPIHLKYLANMAVRSSMSISLNAFNELWGLMACHSYGNHGMRVSFPIRKMCRLVGDTASRNIERLSYASRLQARKLINTAPTDKNPTGYIIASSDDLLRLFDADFGLLSIRGETKILGVIEQSQEALAMLEYLRMRRLTSVVASQDVREDFPDLQYPLGFQVIAGLLYVPLSEGGHDFIVFFRRGQIKEVRWAGNPYEKTLREGTVGYLEPRASFKTWNELVIGKCREWVEEQIETAAVLCLVYGKFIEVWREKEAAIHNTRLTRLLLANSAHEVRTPLNAIINYLEIALEGSLDQETRDNLAKSHSASKALIYVINDLLDLTKTEEGHHLAVQETFELLPCVNEALDPFRIDAERKGIDYQVAHHPGLPRFVMGDSRRVRQVITNITANAIAHTTSGYVNVDIFVAGIREDRQVLIEIAVEDSGSGMTPLQMDGLFRDLEQVGTEELELRSPFEEKEKAQQQMKTLGLGLAVVARILKNAGGQLRLKSKEGEGSRFVIQLPFQLPKESPEMEGEASTNGIVSSSEAISAAKSEPLAKAGEILLIDPNKNTSEAGSMERRSIESRRSGISQDGSQRSQRSDADRLIDAIKTSLSIQDKELDYFAAGQLPTTANFAGTSFPVALKEPLVNRLTPVDEDAGAAKIRDTRMPVRAIKVPDEYIDIPPAAMHHRTGSVSEADTDATESKGPTGAITSAAADGIIALRVLVAEDDPINMKILKKRLERSGNTIQHAVNGQDCAARYNDGSSAFDVVLMDMQMPIVDGLTSTKLIRAMETSTEHKGHSPLASRCGRIPIFAVSASLVEELKDIYVEAGFDGWILKPIDFKRLATLLRGIYDDETRKSCIYVPGEWERGGWFTESSKEVVVSQ